MNGLSRNIRQLILAAGLCVGGLLAGAPAGAIEPPPGTKNFTPPHSVPDYFTNEAAPFHRGARTAQPAADRFTIAPSAGGDSPRAAPAPTRKNSASMGSAKQRGKLTRGRGGSAKAASSAGSARHKAHAAKPRSGKAALSRKARGGSRAGKAAGARRGAKPAARKVAVRDGKAAASRPQAVAEHGRQAVRQSRPSAAGSDGSIGSR